MVVVVEVVGGGGGGGDEGGGVDSGGEGKTGKEAEGTNVEIYCIYAPGTQYH
jgi:hypothetical protein